MINFVGIEGVMPAKPFLLQSKAGEATEFNLEHSGLSGDRPVRCLWRCRATGSLAVEIAERGQRGQRLTVQGELVQELATSADGASVGVVKILVHKASFGKV